MQGLPIRVAWAVNRSLGRKRGKVFSDRYHQHVLGTPSEVRRAMLYVMHNYKHHAMEAETWLLSVGYRLAGGEIDVAEIPGARRRAAPKRK